MFISNLLGVQGAKPLDGVRGVPEKLFFFLRRRRRRKKNR
jgi:hypothetical protein